MIFSSDFYTNKKFWKFQTEITSPLSPLVSPFDQICNKQHLSFHWKKKINILSPKLTVLGLSTWSVAKSRIFQQKSGRHDIYVFKHRTIFCLVFAPGALWKVKKVGFFLNVVQQGRFHIYRRCAFDFANVRSIYDAQRHACVYL